MRLASLMAVAVLGLVVTRHGNAATLPPGFVDSPVVNETGAPILGRTYAVEHEPGSGNLWALQKIDDTKSIVRVRDAVTGAVHDALVLDCLLGTGEAGLLGIAFDPDYLDAGGAHRFVYLHYTPWTGTCPPQGAPWQAVSRISRFRESGGALTDEQVLLEGPPVQETTHFGGGLEIAHDGTLLVSLGENRTEAASRDPSTVLGKILRIGRDGSVPPDNPLVGLAGAREETFSLGLRNPWRFTVDSVTGLILVADVGEGTWEPVYSTFPGADHGWPCWEGPQGPLQTPTCVAVDPASITLPTYWYGHASQTLPVSGRSITGGPVYRGATFPAEYRGNYFFADFVAGWIRRARLTPDGSLVDLEVFAPDAPRVVDFAVSPDGCLTYASLTNGLRQACWVGDGNGPPQAMASADVLSGRTPLPVRFSGSESIDPDGDVLSHEWDFGDGEVSALAAPSHWYEQPGVYEARLVVDDGRGLATSRDAAPPLKIVAGNRAPVATIDAPHQGGAFVPGRSVSFAGRAEDAEDGPLGAERLSWTALLHVGERLRPLLGPTRGVAGGTFQVPAFPERGPDVFVRVTLTATDSGTPIGAAAALTGAAIVDLRVACPVAEEVMGLRLSKAAGGRLRASWTGVTDPCLAASAPRYRLRAAPSAWPIVEPGSYPSDPPFSAVWDDAELDPTFEPGRGSWHFLIVAVGGDGGEGAAGHYP